LAVFSRGGVEPVDHPGVELARPGSVAGVIQLVVRSRLVTLEGSTESPIW